MGVLFAGRILHEGGCYLQAGARQPGGSPHPPLGSKLVLQGAIYWSKSGENLVVIHVTRQNILNEIAKNRVVIQKNRVVIQKNRVIK